MIKSLKQSSLAAVLLSAGCRSFATHLPKKIQGKNPGGKLQVNPCPA